MAKQLARVVLKGSARAAIPDAQDAGPVDPSQQIEVSVLLRRGSSPVRFPSAAQISSQLPLERQYLSRGEFRAAYGASPADVRKVRALAADYSLKVTGEDLASRIVKLTGTVSALGEAFGADLRHYLHTSGKTYRCRTGLLTIPADLENIVIGVFGLDNRPQAKTHFRLRRVHPGVMPHAAAGSFSPVQVARAYQFPAGVTGAGQCIAVIELGGGYQTSDLDSFFRGLGISSPSVTAVSVDGGENTPGGDPNGADGEVELDIEVAGAVAPGAQIVAYFAPNTDQGFIDAVSTAVHDSNLQPSIISISWGGPEDSWTEQARDALNSACQDASTMGVTVVAASGDNGSSDGSSDGAPTVDFPGASPFVLACGGTKLTASGAAIESEEVWNETSANEGATGGGVSQVFALPSYQQSARVPKAPNNFLGRGVPDVAGNADPETGYGVIVDGRQSVIGGTSAVAPLWSGLLALINQALGKNVGFVHPLLYATTARATFHDVTTGNNGEYSAAPGWDACTGLGTPNGAALLSVLRGE